MARAFLIVLDSAGCGGAPDAAAFGDEGSNTLGHIVQACAAHRAEEGRTGLLDVPNLDALGLGAAIRLSTGIETKGLTAKPHGIWGVAQEVSKGKDTPSGHWEIAGVPVPWDWHYFPDTVPAFPADLSARVAELAGTDGILGDCHAPGTAIIDRLGDAHIRTGHPICYTSADSVFQIAAHEAYFGLDRLLALCEALAPELHAQKVGRVIARPFVGTPDAGFHRTPNRRDFAIEPPFDTLLDHAERAGRKTYSVGKIKDIFSGRGITDAYKGTGDASLFDHLVTLGRNAEDGALVFANFVEFDSLFGHRRDVAGYARALEWFDARLPEFLACLAPEDLLLITADHGNDPTWKGTDHTRERVPIVGQGPMTGGVGIRAFADIGASIAHHLGLPFGPAGQSFLTAEQA